MYNNREDVVHRLVEAMKVRLQPPAWHLRPERGPEVRPALQDMTSSFTARTLSTKSLLADQIEVELGCDPDPDNGKAI